MYFKCIFYYYNTVYYNVLLIIEKQQFRLYVPRKSSVIKRSSALLRQFLYFL